MSATHNNTQPRKYRYGSFTVKMRDLEGNREEVVVSPLTQKELANGWSLMVPPVRIIEYNEIKTEHGIKKIKKTNECFFKINLAQLPNELWGRIKTRYTKDGERRSARNNMYVYLINETPFDNEICELRDIVLRHEDGCDVNVDHVKELINLLTENDIKGWVLIRANRI
jgi:hypothetical protein